jgi:hypothetical protein
MGRDRLSLPLWMDPLVANGMWIWFENDEHSVIKNVSKIMKLYFLSATGLSHEVKNNVAALPKNL